MSIAHGGLRHLRDEGLCVTQKHMQERTMALELFFERGARHSIGKPGAMDFGQMHRHELELRKQPLPIIGRKVVEDDVFLRLRNGGHWAISIVSVLTLSAVRLLRTVAHKRALWG